MDPFHNCKAKASFPVRQCVELTKVSILAMSAHEQFACLMTLKMQTWFLWWNHVQETRPPFDPWPVLLSVGPTGNVEKSACKQGKGFIHSNLINMSHDQSAQEHEYSAGHRIRIKVRLDFHGIEEVWWRCDESVRETDAGVQLCRKERRVHL